MALNTSIIAFLKGGMDRGFFSFSLGGAGVCGGTVLVSVFGTGAVFSKDAYAFTGITFFTSPKNLMDPILPFLILA